MGTWAVEKDVFWHYINEEGGLIVSEGVEAGRGWGWECVILGKQNYFVENIISNVKFSEFSGRF